MRAGKRTMRIFLGQEMSFQKPFFFEADGTAPAEGKASR
jgi:hypothetical protein